MGTLRFFAFTAAAIYHWLHKITIEEGKVNMDSLTNSAENIATFHKLMSEATLCHATATSLFHRIFIFLI